MGADGIGMSQALNIGLRLRRLFLFADDAFSLGYRHFEWKCENNTLLSRRVVGCPLY